MVEGSSPVLPPEEESIEAETEIALEPGPESGGTKPELASQPHFVCDCEESMRSACKGLPYYGPHKGRRYCVLHYPRKEKNADFRKVLWEKLAANDFNFCGVWFPEYLDLGNREIDVEVDFRSATFKEHTDFCDTKFLRGADFSCAVFDATADFLEAIFSSGNANFISVQFNSKVDFIRARFLSDSNFASAKFAQDANFDGARFVNLGLGDAAFGTANFSSARFTATANFQSAWFLCNADFGSAKFGANSDFKGTWFVGAQFCHAQFIADADFSGATFLQVANFFCTTFGFKTDFQRTVFNKAGFFTKAVFNGAVNFFGVAEERTLETGLRIKERTLGDEPSLDFQHAEIAKPGSLSFHTLVLRPHWFVNVDPRQFVFTDIGWRWDHIRINEEIDALKGRGVSSPSRLLAIASRQLAENAEVNNRYDEASNFRYWAMELQRQEMDPLWKEEWYEFAFWRLDWWYWATSGYGERIIRAFLMLLGIWVVFMLLYTQVGFTKPESNTTTATPVVVAEPDTVGQPLPFKRAFTYSLAVMSLQKPEPKPLTGTAQTLVLLETILGPVQAALLALAIRRKFMR